MTDHLPPWFRPGDDFRCRAVLDFPGPRRGHIREAEDGGAVEPRRFQRLQIPGDPRLAEIAAHPHPQHARLGGLGRIYKCFFKIRRRRRQSRRCNNECGKECRQPWVTYIFH